MAEMKPIHPLDRARLADLARLQRRHRERMLTADDRLGLFEMVRVLLRRHAGVDTSAQAVVDHLLAHADEAETMGAPTIAMLLKMAARGPQGRETTQEVGG